MAPVALTTISSKRQHIFRIKVPPLFPSYKAMAAQTVSFPAGRHFCPWRVALHGGSMDPPGLAQIKVATELQRGDHGGDPGRWVFREIRSAQATGDPPVEVTHLSDSLLP